MSWIKYSQVRTQYQLKPLMSLHNKGAILWLNRGAMEMLSAMSVSCFYNEADRAIGIKPAVGERKDGVFAISRSPSGTGTVHLSHFADEFDIDWRRYTKRPVEKCDEMLVIRPSV